MPRVKRGTVRRAKRKKLLARAKGFYQTKSKLYRQAKESVDTAAKYAYVGRKNKKREYRRLWVVRINAAAREHGLSYSVFMRGLKAAGVDARPQDAGRPGRHAGRRVRGSGGPGQGRAARRGARLASARDRRWQTFPPSSGYGPSSPPAWPPPPPIAISRHSTTSSSAASPARSRPS